MIPAGTFSAVAVPVSDEATGRMVYARFGTTGEGPNEKKQVVVTFKLTSGEAAGQTISWFGFFTEKTWERTVKALRSCGFRGDDLSELTTQVLSNEVNLVIEHEEWEGKVRAKVAWVNGTGGVALKNPMKQDDLKRFAAMMKGRVKGVAEAPAAVSTPAPQERVPGSDDGDDLNF